MMILHYLPTSSKGFGLLFITFMTITFVFTQNNGSQLLNIRGSRKLQSLSFANTFPDKNLVADLMQLSQDIFDVDNGVPPQDAISNPNYEFKFWIEAPFSTEAMIVTAHHNTKTIIVFRGSEEREDWEVNLNFPTEKSEFVNAPDSVKIHRGFQSALFDQNIVSALESKLLELIGTDGDVIVTGHSLG
jgi:hypothetical protein